MSLPGESSRLGQSGDRLFSVPVLSRSTDEWETPPHLFDEIHARYRFTVDAAALPHNAKLPRYWSPTDDGLAQNWTGERVWCNPPYSDIPSWAAKAEDSDAELVVMLVPANRTEQRWWHEHSARVEFLGGRVRFLQNGVVGGSPRFGCCLLIWERR